MILMQQTSLQKKMEVKNKQNPRIRKQDGTDVIRMSLLPHNSTATSFIELLHAN